MRTCLHKFSRRLSLLAAVLCLFAVLPGHGLAREVASVSAAEGEPQFSSERDQFGYGWIHKYDGQGRMFCDFSMRNMTGDMALYVRLEDPSNPMGVKFRYQRNGVDKEYTLNEGGYWVDPADLYAYGNEGENKSYYFRLESRQAGTVKFFVELYASKDLSSAKLDSDSFTARFMPEDQIPKFAALERVSGELDTDVPLKINVRSAGFLQGQPARIRVHVNLSEGWEGFSLTGENLTADPENNRSYNLEISSFSAAQYTLTARALERCSGTYSIELLDAEGHRVDYLGEGAISIPINYSAEDIAALKAMAEANPLNKDLQDFISSGDYLKDIEESSERNVGVVWNTETPGRVRSFFIDDWMNHTVSALDFSALTGLERLELSGTRLKSLDLSASTKLNDLNLNGNDSLTWFTVKLPSPLPLNLNGSTLVSGGISLDGYNAYASVGTEIDLSAYAEVDGVKSVYQWYRIEREPSYMRTEVTMEAVAGKEGAFIFGGKPGEYYECEVTNANYGYWRMATPKIKVARGSDSYSPVDVAALKKLAADNPNVTQLQEFVASEGWKNENWDSYSDAIATNWSTDEVGRLTHLRIRMDWNSKDTVSSLDLSTFTELKYFECERYMNISKLDLSKNTKLEELYIYSKELTALDLSRCPNLRKFRFGTLSTEEGSYQATKLATLNLSGCTNLTDLYLEHAPLAALDLSPFKNLDRLHIEYCPNLKLSGFEGAARLYNLELPNTTQFGDLIRALPASIRHLYLQKTEYELPSAEIGKNLQTLGIPGYVESFDLAVYPNLLNLNVGGSRLRYSALKNYRSINYNGMSRIELTSPSHPNTPQLFENGDTIDLSSEAVFNGVETVFLWVNAKYNTEEKEAIKAVPGRPGVFVLDSKEEKYGAYRCKLMNSQFCRITDINVLSGWQIETSYINVETSVPQVFAESDVATLARLVSDSNNKALTEWWSSGAWQTNENSSNAQAIWNNENPRRLEGLYLYQMGNSFTNTVDLSALDKLRELSLTGNQVEKLTLPKNNTVLRSLMLGGNTPLKSLIVSEYPNLEYVDVRGTGLTALDLTNNKKVNELFLNDTEIPAVSADVAAGLRSYGVPRMVKEIDLEQFPALTQFVADGSALRFSDVKDPRQLEKASGNSLLLEGKAHVGGYSAYGESLDVTEQATVGGTASRVEWRVNGQTVENAGATFAITEALAPNDKIRAIVTNDLFPGWALTYQTLVYTCDGDANLDKGVNVQDVTATVSYILKDSANMITNFGWAEADVNYNNKVEIADVIGIVNIIRDQPVTKAGMLRAEAELPVQVELDTDNFLTLSSQVPVAGIYLELVGVTEELPLVGEAAKFLQASHRDGDTLRVIGYSLDGRTIPSGKTRVLRMPAGVTLVGASFSDTKANNLRATGGAIVTSNAPIEAIGHATAVSNFPNPFRGSTTFRYQLAEPADAVTIHVFSANGALAAVLNGLPGEVGENRHTAALPLPAGVYYYRLTAKSGRGVNASNTNILIIQ